MGNLRVCAAAPVALLLLLLVTTASAAEPDAGVSRSPIGISRRSEITQRLRSGYWKAEYRCLQDVFEEQCVAYQSGRVLVDAKRSADGAWTIALTAKGIAAERLDGIAKNCLLGPLSRALADVKGEISLKLPRVVKCASGP